MNASLDACEHPVAAERPTVTIRLPDSSRRAWPARATSDRQLMARKYRKVDPRFWRDERVRPLSAHDKLVALYLFTAQCNRIGCYSFSPGRACEDMCLPRLPTHVRHVVTALGWEWDETAGVVYLPTWWRYNQPENPSVLIGVLADIDDVPDSPLVTRFCANTKYLDASLLHTWSTRLPTHVPTHQAHQEQEQEQEQELTTLSSAQTTPALDNALLNGFKSEAREVLDFLNRKTGRAYRAVPVNLTLIEARLKSGATRAQMQAVIAVKAREWIGDATMAKFLRPATLFGAAKFEQYLGQLPQGEDPDGQTQPRRVVPEWARGLSREQVAAELKRVSQGSLDG